MPLATLTLSTTSGVQGRPFQATIAGLTTGRVEVLADASPGFVVVNGKVLSRGLPYPVSTVALREYDPGAATPFRDTRIDITAASAASLRAQAIASLDPGRTLKSSRTVSTRQADGSYVYTLLVEDDLGAARPLPADGGTPTPTPGPTLSALTLAASGITENSAAGTVVGGVLGTTTGSSLSLLDSAGGRFALSGGNLVAGATGTDYETATSHSITIRETLAGATNTPRDTVLGVTVANVFEQASLAALSLSSTSFTSGTSASGSITGATTGSTIAATGLPTGLTINGPARTFAWDGSGSAGTPTITLTETLADSANSPRVSNVGVTVAAAGLTDDFFANSIASAPWYSQAVGNSTLYDATTNRFLLGYEGFNPLITTRRSAYVKVLNGTTLADLGTYKMFDSQLTDDDHGVPAVVIHPYNGRAYAFGGAHGGTQSMLAAMSGVGDFTTWTALTSVAPSGGAGYAYPHPVCVGNVIYLYMRKQSGSPIQAPLVYVVGTIAGDGTVTWGSEVNLVDFGSDSRVYASNPITLSQSGNNHVSRLMFVMADGGDTYRQDVFVCDHDTSAGLLKAVTGSYTRSTASAMPLVTARTNIRITAQQEGGLYTNVASHAFDTAGNYHVLYMEDADGGSYPLDADMDWKWRLLSGGSFGTAQTLFQTRNRYDQCELVPTPSGAMDAIYVGQDSYGFLRGGDMRKLSRPSGGPWGSTSLVRAASKYGPLNVPVAVTGGTAALRYVFGEFALSPAQGSSGGTNNVTLGNMRAFAMGDSGPVTFGLTYHSKVAAWAARGSPSESYVRAVNTLIAGLADKDWLARIDSLWLLAGPVAGNSALALYDVIGSRNITNVGASFTAINSGYAWTGNGTSAYLDTGFIPNTHGVGYTKDSAQFMICVLNSGTIGFVANCAATGDNLTLRPTNGTNCSARINDAGGNNFANTSAIGHYAVRRTGSTARGTFKDGAQLGADTVASTARPTSSLKLLGDGNAGNYTAHAVSCAVIGGAWGFSDQIPLTAAFRRFNLEIGVGVL